MLPATRKALAIAAMLLATATAACDDSPTDPGAQPVTSVAGAALNASTVRLTFVGLAGDSAYFIERAPGASGGAFVQVATVAAPAVGGTVTYDDAGLAPASTFRYRVLTRRGGQTSVASTGVIVTTASPGTVSKDVTGDITVNTHWTADTVYVLKGFIHVKEPAVLTIDPGTTIKGDFATLGSSLFVLPGARIVAVGTAANPIVFTSSQAADSRKPGDWGGLIIVGRAPVNRSGVVDIEGTGTATGGVSGTNYAVPYSGGSTPTDNSGELRYVRVEYAGYAPSVNNELNSFTFAAVGSGTKLSYLQAMAGLDDSFEWFGGTVDAHHLVSYESGDDHFDMSEGYRGRLQFLIAYQSTQLAQRTGAGSASTDPQGIENDGCNGTGCDLGFNSTPLTIPLVANFTLVGTGNTASSGSGGGFGMVLRRGTGGYYVNGIVARYPRGGAGIRDSLTFVRAGSAATPDLATADLAMRNILFAEVPVVFETGTQRYAFDLAANGLVNSGATAASLFTTFTAAPTTATTAAGFDWTPPTGSASATAAAYSAFTGRIATLATTVGATGHTFAATSYVGAAQPGGSKWWHGWTVYNQD